VRERVVVRTCRAATPAEEVAALVNEAVGDAITDTGKLGRARKVLVKPNLGIRHMEMFKGRPTTVVDTDVFEGVCRFLRHHTDAEIIYGDGMSGIDIDEAVRERGYAEIADRYRMHLVDMHEAPYTNFEVPDPAMFGRYTLSSRLEDVDYVVSIAKMKTHHLCGVTLSQKNLFGIPPGPVYGNPRFALHSTIRLPLLLVDLAQLFPPDLCVIDGIIGGNFSEWQGDPVSSGLLVAGSNCVAVDATAARLMHVDPTAPRGVSPFINADNHIRVASEHGLGPVGEDGIEVAGDVPDHTLPYATAVSGDSRQVAETEAHRRTHCINAKGYFERHEEYADQYEGRLAVFHEGEVLFDMLANNMAFSDFLGLSQARSLNMYEVFAKLVERDDPERREPYELALAE
jgi:uncharacterized protein (DUF362 family)